MRKSSLVLSGLVLLVLLFMAFVILFAFESASLWGVNNA